MLKIWHLSRSVLDYCLPVTETFDIIGSSPVQKKCFTLYDHPRVRKKFTLLLTSSKTKMFYIIVATGTVCTRERFHIIVHLYKRNVLHYYPLTKTHTIDLHYYPCKKEEVYIIVHRTKKQAFYIVIPVQKKCFTLLSPYKRNVLHYCPTICF